MTVQDYLQQKVQSCAQYTLSEAEKKKLDDVGLKEFLRANITRKKFRKWKIDAITENKINDVLAFCISDEKPIIFRFWFGGYKLWRFSTAPEVDWAEFFAVTYYCEYLAPIIATYKPGVQLLFESDEVFVERLNNIPQSDTDAYQTSFEKLMDLLSPHFPPNFDIDYVRHRDAYDSVEEFETEYAQEIEKAEKAWEEKSDEERRVRKLKTSRMNIKWDGVEDLTGLSENEKQRKIKRSVILHDALNTLPTMHAFTDAPNKIPIFNTPVPGDIAIGSTKASSAKFWVGTGVLERRGEKYYDHVITWEQYKDVKDLPHEGVPVDILPLNNFKSIDVYDILPNFSLR